MLTDASNILMQSVLAISCSLMQATPLVTMPSAGSVEESSASSDDDDESDDGDDDEEEGEEVCPSGCDIQLYDKVRP